MAASQHEFCSYKLPIYKKKKYDLEHDKTAGFFITLIFYHNVKQDHYLTHFLSYAYTVLRRSSWKNPPLYNITRTYPIFYKLSRTFLNGDGNC